ncbi:MAG: hypothetical protein HC771_19355 [Synechococcales cyanobacterium CRU_2_2]|nr:hypothetical protein [Synechococcales cyanobacterium CRU_2_2]
MIHAQFVAVATETGGHFPSLFALVYGVGFVAAVVGGSLAWYNSKRPAGWEDAERPSFIPEIKTKLDRQDSDSKN